MNQFKTLTQLQMSYIITQYDPEHFFTSQKQNTF